MQTTIVPGILTWSRWQPDRQLFFNSWLVATAGGQLAIDPLEPDAEDLAQLDALALHAVVVTNRDHERAASTLAARYGIPVWAPEADADEMTVRVDRRFRDGDDLCGWRAITFDGFKTPGESALVRDRVAITGDAFWGVPAGALALMPDEKLADPARAALSSRRLLATHPAHLLVGDGAPVYHRAYEALAEMLDARAGVFTRRVNVDDAPLLVGPWPAPFATRYADVGRLLGAQRLGYMCEELAPGQRSSPYHWHTREEELLVVLRGAAKVRTPKGTFAIRAGDVVAFPLGSGGAHRMENDGDESCVYLVIANTDEGDTCFYPDSRKLLVEAADTIVRSEPELAYFDGELPS